MKVNVFCAKPGIVIGKGGAESAKIEKQLAKLTGKAVNLNIIEVKAPPPMHSSLLRTLLPSWSAASLSVAL